MIHLYDVYNVDDVGLGKKNQRHFCQYYFFLQQIYYISLCKISQSRKKCYRPKKLRPEMMKRPKMNDRIFLFSKKVCQKRLLLVLPSANPFQKGQSPSRL